MPNKPTEFWSQNGKRVLEVIEEEYKIDPDKGFARRAYNRLNKEIPDFGSFQRMQAWVAKSGWSERRAQLDGSAVRFDQDSIQKQRNLRAQHAAAVKEEVKALRELTGEHSLRRFLVEQLKNTVQHFPPPPKFKPVARADRGVTKESFLLCLSDWHAYEQVSSARMRGLNEYDSRIFGQRVKKIVESTVSIKKKIERGKLWRFPHLVVGANGDFVSGTIHEVERHSEAPNIIMAVYGCATTFAQALRDLSAEFKTIEVFCTPGNHGRLPDARRMQMKDPTRNWDTIIYILAMEMLADCPNIRFYIPDSYTIAFEVEGWTFLQSHGHDIRSWNQIPYYGMQRQVSNIGALEAARGKAVHYFLWGHFHSKSTLDTVVGESIVNGSLIGGTEFSLGTMARCDKPSQWLLGVHQDWGVTHRWSLNPQAEPEYEGYDTQPWTGGVFV